MWEIIGTNNKMSNVEISMATWCRLRSGTRSFARIHRGQKL